MSGKMNWNRVRNENRILKHGSASVASWMVTDSPFEPEGENRAFDIRCNPADGDCCHTFNMDRQRILAVIYSLGGDFDSKPRDERKKRLQFVFKLIDWGAREVKRHIEKEFMADLQEQ